MSLFTNLCHDWFPPYNAKCNGMDDDGSASNIYDGVVTGNSELQSPTSR